MIKKKKRMMFLIGKTQIGKMQNEKSHHLELLSESTFYFVFGIFPGGIAVLQIIQLLKRGK